MHVTEDILIKFLLGETTAEENRAVEMWLDADEANRKHFVQIESIWNNSHTLSPANKINEDEAWARFKIRVQSNLQVAPIETPLNKEAIVKPLNPGFRWMRIAAVLVLISGVVLLTKYVGQGQYTDLTTDQAVFKQTLPDGSEITLNKHSSLSFAKNFKEDRSIRLKEGEAFFEVTSDKQHPFVIDAGEVTVEVVGTSFNVKHINDTTEVIVETGIVSVNHKQQKLELRKGEKVLIVPGSTNLQKLQNTDQLYNFYQTKVLTVINTPISRIAEVLNKTYGSDVRFKNDETGRLTITTTFEDQSLDQIIEIICETLNLKAEHKENQIILSKQ